MNISFLSLICAQEDDIYNLFRKFGEQYNKGNYIEAEKLMLKVIESEPDNFPDIIVPAYNNMGLIKKSLGFYSEALRYYDKCEELMSRYEKVNTMAIAGIYINKSRIFTFQRSYPTAIDYLEKAIRLYNNIEKPNKTLFQYLSTAYLNIGIVYNELGEYKSALENLDKSLRLKIKYKLNELELVYMNIARSYERTDQTAKADEFFRKCMNTIKIEYGGDYFRMAEIYFGYGTFLNNTERCSEALNVYENALSICTKNYGEKHSIVALAYKYIGDFYLQQVSYTNALENYQKSLISISGNFSNTDIFSNPSIDSSLLDIRLLDILKSKAEALNRYQKTIIETPARVRYLKIGLETIDLAISLAERIRNNYPTEESMILLAGHEKETTILGVQIAESLYQITGGKSYITKMYSILQRSKASVLHDEITINEWLPSGGISDSLINAKNNLAGNIAAYNNLIIEESREINPDSDKLILWKDALFTMNREMEKLKTRIEQNLPQTKRILIDAEPVTPDLIRKELHRNETVVDYLLSNWSADGKRDLYIFIIKRKRIDFRKVILDTIFIKQAGLIKESFRKTVDIDFESMTSSLSYMYDKLIRPVKDLFAGKRIIIIPDEEIFNLPFEAFLMKIPASDQIDFEGLDYLINEYALSYNYSSSLIYNRYNSQMRNWHVISFAPDYKDVNGFAGLLGELKGAEMEIEAINKWFRSKSYSGRMATETNFRLAIRKQALLHLAMHTLQDTSESRYSSLLFSTVGDSLNDGRLYNYEISNTVLQSPMVVLSACNSGSGILYHGEGVLSIARGFLLAGALSVIRTSWDINDDASALIIQGFYKHLSKGRHKDESMRLAKLEYMRNSPPSFSNPYFWAAYEVLGSNAPVKFFPVKIKFLVLVIILIAGGVLISYFKRRRIFDARPR
ncbi:MAG: CHAT domain-containing protein [Bacteroidales bacterium]|nr:CHAT domain-containing protein [Bacteroidales bacterium]